MPLFKPEDLRPGRRVELHPATDEWMSGDRYGTITRENVFRVFD